jgi:hypothetical protein
MDRTLPRGSHPHSHVVHELDVSLCLGIFAINLHLFDLLLQKIRLRREIEFHRSGFARIL